MLFVVSFGMLGDSIAEGFTERLITDPSYNDIEIVSSSLEEFLNDIQKPGVKFTAKGGIEELKKRVAREKKEKNNKKER